MAVFLISTLVLSSHLAAAQFGCWPTAGTEGKCAKIFPPADSLCNSVDMRKRCCPGNSAEKRCSSSGPEPNEHYWNSEQDPSTPQPEGLSVTPSPVDCISFNLTISWNQVDEATGYVVELSYNEYTIGSFSTNNTNHTHLTIPNICYSADNSVMQWKVTAKGSHELGNGMIRRENCYTLFKDPDMQRSKCGPKVSDKLDTSMITIVSTRVSEELFNATISWPSIDSTHLFDLKLQASHNHYFNISNSNKIVLTGLNSSAKAYKLYIRPITECAGMYSSEDDYMPCAVAEGIEIPLPLTTTAPFTSSIVTSSSIPHSSSNAHSSPSPSSYSTPHLINASGPESSNRVVIIAVVLPGSLLLFLLVLLVTFIVIRKYFGLKSKPRPPSPNSSQNALLGVPSPLPSPLLFPVDYNGVVSSPTYPQSANSDDYIYQFPTIKQKVLVLYSLDTPESEKRTINELLYAGLGSFNIQTETPDTISQRNISRDWMEKGIGEASAVFFVCNEQFYREWQESDSPRHVGGARGGVKIGRDARMLKNGISNQDLAKFAFVHFKSSDDEFFTSYPAVLTPFITHYYSLVGDKLATVHSIASFVQNVPRYA